MSKRKPRTVKITDGYLFRREDTGEIITVDFAAMLDAKNGFLELPDGVMARRVYQGIRRKRETTTRGCGMPIVSDAMGVTVNQIAEFEADRKANGFTDMEFRQDPTEPTFYQAHFTSERAKARYMKHRGMHDRNSRNGSGAMLSPESLENATELACRLG